MENRTILITGAAGYIGGHVTQKFVSQNHKVICLDNLSRSKAFHNKKSINIEGDFSDSNILQKIFDTYKIDAVVHLAAFAYVGESVDSPQDYYLNNTAKSLELFRIMLKSNVRNLVFTSSCAIYGNAAYLPIDEEHPQEPINPYGKSKLYIEQILRDYLIPYNFSTICFRLFNVAGCGTDFRLQESHDPETHVIPLILKQARAKKQKISIGDFAIYGADHDTADGTSVRDFVHVEDLATAFYLAAIKLVGLTKPIFSSYNLSNEKGFSVKQIIKMVEKVSGEIIDTSTTIKRIGDPAELVGSATKAKIELGWEPQHSSLEEMIRSAWDALNS
jgi:UDP-glucose 4-epimerase